MHGCGGGNMSVRGRSRGWSAGGRACSKGRTKCKGWAGLYLHALCIGIHITMVGLQDSNLVSYINGMRRATIGSAIAAGTGNVDRIKQIIVVKFQSSIIVNNRIVVFIDVFANSIITISNSRSYCTGNPNDNNTSKSLVTEPPAASVTSPSQSSQTVATPAPPALRAAPVNTLSVLA